MKATTSIPIFTLTSSIVFIGFLKAAGLMAQGVKPSFPHEPLLARAPSMAVWMVTYQYPSDDKREDKKKLKTPKYRITSVQTEKTGNIYHKITCFDTGAKSETWSVDGRELVKENNSPSFVPTPASGPIADDYSKSDFEDLDWLSMKCYVGLEKGEHSEFIFSAKYKDRTHTRREKMTDAILNVPPIRNNVGGSFTQIEPLDQNVASAVMPDRQLNGESKVLLDARTQLPVEYDQGAVKWTYQFLTPPTSQLVPPPEVNATLKQWDAYIKASGSSTSSP